MSIGTHFLRTMGMGALVATVACGGLAQADGPAADGASSPSAPSGDALTCAAEPMRESVTKDARPSLGIVAFDATHAYWARHGQGSADGQIVRAPLAGGPVEILASGISANGLAVDATHVYWTERDTANGRVVARIVKSGGLVETVVGQTGTMVQSWDETFAAELSRGGRIAIDGESIVWTGDQLGGGFALRDAILRTPKAGGVTATVTLTHAAPIALAVDRSGIYWTEGEVRADYGREALAPSLRVIGADGTERVLAEGKSFGFPSHGRGDPNFALATDETSVFWLSQVDGTVLQIPKAGGPPTVLAADQHDMIGIAVGGGYVYWSDAGRDGKPGKLSRVPTAGGEVVSLGPAGAGLAYSPDGLLVVGNELARLRTCPR